MNMISYVVLHIYRAIKMTFTTLFSYITVLALLATIQQSVQSRQNMLETMAEALQIECSIADRSGYTTEALYMDNALAEQFTSPYGSMTHLVENVRAKVAAEFIGYDMDEYLLIGITCEEADINLKFSMNTIVYDEGYDASIWESNKAVCVISPELEHLTYQDENGLTCVDFTKQLVTTNTKEAVTMQVKLCVVGYTDMSQSVILPYQFMCESYKQYKDIPPLEVDSLSFRVKNNKQLDQLRDRAHTWFADATIIETENELKNYSLVINDAAYLELIQEAQKNLTIMQLMQPILYLCALGAGVMLVVMQMRGRKKEMAVIRSLGAGKMRVMAQSILEYALICLPVTLFALLVWRELSPMTVLGVWLAFMAGAMCTIVRFSMIPLVKQIRELEE